MFVYIQTYYTEFWEDNIGALVCALKFSHVISVSKK